ncbi:tumor necrosis factor receptor superfamily member 10A isoform X2 [Physeter macrocephalus]|uniref:Tumor necrosis factor receptor superfamily member 10A isoform X2 n=1 Tax=Physeter macrocephalus TaxID=9755 RepID=A0A2Y9ELR8_PHYMC|nr:tumor necrosis factor receptor superfamily member 10A isoform X2 [Physeter catodon]|eukprot:XP_007104182.1 tumor necrosis factor receptor superfamily member 10A isoform X2 [Physeter catodon]
MALPAVTSRRPEQRALPDRTRQQGQSAPAASGSRASVPSPRPPFRCPRALIFVSLGVLLSIVAASAMHIRQEEFRQQLTAPQGWNRSLSKKLCPPGFHMEEASGDCTPCLDKVDYTNYSNTLPSCLLCRICKSGEEEKSPCTSTKDTECQCKPGTFRREDAPEFCYKCSTRCPDGMVVATPCSPFSDLKCVDQQSGTSQLGIGTVAGITAACVLLLALIAYVFWRFIIKGYGVDPKCMGRVFFRHSHPLRGPGALDNAHNNMMINRDSLIDLVPEQEVEEQVKPTDVTAQSQGEAKRLLEPAEAEGSHTRRRLLVPANGADPTESLRLFFDDFANIVPCDSWDSLLRQLGLTRNDILLAREGVRVPRDALYEMLETWVRNKGREASVNTLLDALEKLGQILAKQKIQDHLLESGTYVYEESEAGSAVSRVFEDLSLSAEDTFLS